MYPNRPLLRVRWLALAFLILVTVPFVGAQGVGQRGTTSVGFAPNETSTGTTQYLLAKLVAGKAIKALTTDTAIALYVVVSPTAITGDAVYVVAGPTSCIMDATNGSGVSGQPVIASTTTAGRCHVQASLPAAGWIVGILSDDATTAGSTAKMNAQPAPSFPATGAGSGTVTSVTVAAPAELTPSGCTITTAGTCTFTKATQAANSVWAGPTTGSAAAPTFRAPVAADIASALAGTTAQGDLTGTHSNYVVSQASAAFAFTGIITPTTLSGNVNDYAPTSLSTATTVRLSGGTSDRDVTGLTGGASGRVVLIANIGTTNALIFRHQSTSSSATNRFLLGSDISLSPGDTLALSYDGTTQRWRPVGQAMPDAFKVRPCQLSLGSPGASAAPLADDEDAPDSCGNDYGRDWVVTGVACKANAGTPTITPILTGGSATSILTGALTCATTWSAGTVNGTPTLHTFTGATCASTPCSLDMNVTAAGGVASYLTVRIIGILK